MQTVPQVSPARPHPHDVRAKAAERQEQAHEAELQRQLEIADVTWMLSDQAGRRIAWGLFLRSGILSDNGAFNPNAMEISHGRGGRHVVFRLWEIATRHCVAQWNLMREENDR